MLIFENSFSALRVHTVRFILKISLSNNLIESYVNWCSKQEFNFIFKALEPINFSVVLSYFMGYLFKIPIEFPLILASALEVVAKYSS